MDNINEYNSSNLMEYRKCQNMRMYKRDKTRMWANAQPDGRPAKYRWRPLFNAAKFG